MPHELSPLAPRPTDKAALLPRTTRAAGPTPLDRLEEQFFAAYRA